MKFLLEYVWIDGIENLRSKNRVITNENNELNLNDVPKWTFDGSSTKQAIGKHSDIILNPVRLYKNPFVNYMSSYLVLCDCYNKDLTPHETNKRYKCIETNEKYKEHECLFGIEQEYILFERKKNSIFDFLNKNLPYKWKKHNDPELGEQNPYYCSVGGDRNFGREICDEHLKLCLDAGIDICGTNAEVMASQWEFQIGVCDMLKVSDDLWMARYILHKITEKYNCFASFHPKPYVGNWNGSGGHTNFSTNKMRENDGLEHINNACEKLKLKHTEHIKVYGKENEKRLTGKHETSGINEFSYGVGNRGCSIRIPLHVFNDKKGYLEDRRPASNLDPYLVTNILVETICH